MTNQLQVYQGLEFGDLTTQDVATIRDTIAKDCNDSQFGMFMAVAKSSGANPLTNEIYAAVRGGQLTIQYGIDLYVRKAREAVGYKGHDVQIIHENDDVVITRKTNEDGESFMVVTEHGISFPRGKAIACYAIAFREGVAPYSVFMEVNAVEHLKKSGIGMQKTMWTNYFDDMFSKHVLKRALRGQFGLEFDDHVADTGTPEQQPKERKDITPHQEVIQDVPKKDNKEVAEDPTNNLRDEINGKFKQLGITTQKAVTEYLEKNLPGLNSKTATETEMVGLIELLDMHIDLKQSEENNEDALL